MVRVLFLPGVLGVFKMNMYCFIMYTCYCFFGLGFILAVISFVILTNEH